MLTFWILSSRDRRQDQDLIPLFQLCVHAFKKLNRLAVDHDPHIRKDGATIGIKKATGEFVSPPFFYVCQEILHRRSVGKVNLHQSLADYLFQPQNSVERDLYHVDTYTPSTSATYASPRSVSFSRVGVPVFTSQPRNE